jgi:RHS repeat-associated protein
MSTRYYHYDGLGSTQLLTDQNANVTDSYCNTAFGKPVDTGGANPTPNPFQYIGQKGYYLDNDTGDYYVRSRFFRPALSRWLSVDSKGFAAADANLFRYAANRPQVATDPSGFQVLLPPPFFVPKPNRIAPTPEELISPTFWDNDNVAVISPSATQPDGTTVSGIIALQRLYSQGSPPVPSTPPQYRIFATVDTVGPWRSTGLFSTTRFLGSRTVRYENCYGISNVYGQYFFQGATRTMVHLEANTSFNLTLVNDTATTGDYLVNLGGFFATIVSRIVSPPTTAVTYGAYLISVATGAASSLATVLKNDSRVKSVTYSTQTTFQSFHQDAWTLVASRTITSPDWTSLYNSPKCILDSALNIGDSYDNYAVLDPNQDPNALVPKRYSIEDVDSILQKYYSRGLVTGWVADTPPTTVTAPSVTITH